MIQCRELLVAGSGTRIVRAIGYLIAATAIAAANATPVVNIKNGPLLASTENAELSFDPLKCPRQVMPTLNSQISTDGIYVYQAGAFSSISSGYLKKRAMLMDAGGKADPAATAIWDAGEILTGTSGKPPVLIPAERKIYTLVSNGERPWSIAEFRWENLSTVQKAFLDASPVTGKGDGLGEKRLEYLRGFRNLELGQPGGIFRPRERILGDIANSNLAVVGAPAAFLPGANYQKFRDEYKSRLQTVYVGANDGMLHAFNAVNGQELFAYVPNTLISGLNQLSRPDYVHQPYVDGGITTAEALVAGDWKTVLASGFGGGAQGVFALDISDPEKFGENSKALWEFTDSDDADMGNLLSPPAIARFGTTLSNGTQEYKYFVVVPSGLNNYKNDGVGKFSGTAAGALFLLSLDKSPSAKWQQNVNYYKLKTPLKEVDLQNGLSVPVFVLGDGGAVRYAYAGDLQGNLWRFDFTGAAPWLKAQSGDVPLFVAKDMHDQRQPISSQPKVVFAPGGGYVVLFGTGKFIEDADAAAANFKTQTFYGIYDNAQPKFAITGRGQLESRVAAGAGDALTISGNVFSYGEGASSRRGWYLDFPDSEKSGERSVTNPATALGRLFFNTLIPDAGQCKAAGSRSYALDPLTGLPVEGNKSGFASDIGTLSAPYFFETGSAAGNKNAVGTTTVTKKYKVVSFGSAGAKENAAQLKTDNSSMSASANVRARRLSWREVPNWQELRDATNKK